MALQILKKPLHFLIQVNSVKSVEFLAFESCKGYWKNISVTYDNILVAVLKCQINVIRYLIFLSHCGQQGKEIKAGVALWKTKYWKKKGEA